MSFSSHKQSINDILSRNCAYIIPLNQRKYVWDEPEWNELFEDLFLIEQKDDYAHFLGSFVFSKIKNKNKFEVIDGQQRLITISIILCCLISRLYKINEDKIAESIKNTFLVGNEDGEQYFKVARADGNFFLTQIIDLLTEYISIEKLEKEFSINFNCSDKYNEKFLKCYKYYDERIQEFLKFRHKSQKDMIILLKNKLIKCEAIEISVTNEVDGFRIFETLNARGVPLEQHELIKNYIYSYMRSSPKQQKVTNTWAKIISNLTFKKIDGFSWFLSHYCTHIYGKTKKNEEFKTIRNNTPKSGVENLLNSLYENSVYYKYIEEPEEYKNSSNSSEIIYSSLTFFKNLNIRQVRPVLLSLFEKYFEKFISIEKFENVVLVLEKFYFLYVIVLKNTTNTIDNTITNLSKKIHDDSIVDVDLIGKELQSFLPERDAMISSFSTAGYSNKNKKYKNSSNKKIANYVLKKIEDYYDENDELNIKIKSIEHIMNDSEENDFTSYFGNLLPLSTKMNNKIGDKPFNKKMEYYAKSNLLTVKKFVKHYSSNVDWTEENIKFRTKKIAELAIDKIWKI